MPHTKRAADLRKRIEPPGSLGRGQHAQDFETQNSQQEPAKSNRAIEAQKLPDQARASTVAHRLTTQYSQDLNILQFLTKEFVKEREDIEWIILSEKHYSH